jgi:hypothetical protein
MQGVPARAEWTTRAFILATNLHYRSHVRKRIIPGIV